MLLRCLIKQFVLYVKLCGHFAHDRCIRALILALIRIVRFTPKLRFSYHHAKIAMVTLLFEVLFRTFIMTSIGSVAFLRVVFVLF